MPAFLVVAYFAASFIARILRGGPLVSDEAEQVFLSHALQIGYGDQPPLYNWLVYGFGQLFGVSLETLAFVKSGTLLLSCVFLAMAARAATNSRDAMSIAALGILSLPAVFLLSQRDLTHSVGAFAAVSLFLYTVFLLVKRPTALNYGLVGAAAGIGFLAKYNFAIIPVAMVAALLLEPGLRRLALNWRMAIALAVGVLIVGPHCYWIVTHFGDATGDTISKMKTATTGPVPDAVKAAFSLILSIFKCAALTLGLFALVYRSDLVAILTASNQWTRLVGRTLAISLMLVLVVMVAVDGTMVRPKWISIFFLALPLYLALKVHAAGIERPRNVESLACLVGVIAFVFLAIVSVGAVV
ncbi:4-amino-4-deoxy-L-arabinose transferase [Rhizobium sp. Root1220]|nr:4-amino-4-deoxy-L-arabinose transferase [Rhizobium sp. Root1220]